MVASRWGQRVSLTSQGLCVLSKRTGGCSCATCACVPVRVCTWMRVCVHGALLYDVSDGRAYAGMTAGTVSLACPSPGAACSLVLVPRVSPAISYWPVVSGKPFPWETDVVDGAFWVENAVSAGRTVACFQRGGSRCSPGPAPRLLCGGCDFSAEDRFSLCYYMPCRADVFLPETFKAKARI